MLKFFQILIFSLFIYSNALANSDISKLNSLYLNGVIDKNTYFKSINGLGIDTSNQIFQNLFELFSNSVLDISSYENSLQNLRTVSNSDNSKKNLEKNSDSSKIMTTNSNYKTYVIENCKGDSALCKDLANAPISFELIDNKVNVVQSDFDELLKDPELLKISQIRTFVKNDDFDIVVSILHIKGFIIDFVFGGVLENNQFEMVDLSLKGNGQEIISAKLISN
jgi:hypothetical protein